MLFLHLLQEPFSRVLVDVVPDFVIVLLVTDHMVVITFLPDVFTIFLVAKPFQGSYKTGNCGGPFRRDTPPGVSLFTVKGNQHMNMVGHDHVFIHGEEIVIIVHLTNIPVSNQTVGKQAGTGLFRTPREGCPYADSG